jgi:hypothetical protein
MPHHQLNQETCIVLIKKTKRGGKIIVHTLTNYCDASKYKNL